MHGESTDPRRFACEVGRKGIDLLKQLPKIVDCIEGTALFDAVNAYLANDQDEFNAVECRQAAVLALDEAERKAYDPVTPATDRATLKLLLSELTADVSRYEAYVASCQRERGRLAERVQAILQEATELSSALVATEKKLLPGGYFDQSIQDAQQHLAACEEDKRNAQERLPRVKHLIEAKIGGKLAISGFAW